MSSKYNIELGQTANLLFGYRPNWNPISDNAAPFFEPKEGATITFPIEQNDQINQWSPFPTITLHQNAESLVSRLYKYKVLPLVGEPDGLVIPAGQLVLNNSDREEMLSAIGNYLGIDLKADYAFMLVEISRLDRTLSHEFIHDFGVKNRVEYLSRFGQDSIAELTAGQQIGSGPLFDAKIDKNQAKAYVDTIYKLGTHFVSKVSMGNTIYQVFAYKKQEFEILEMAFDRDAIVQDGIKLIQGSNALSFEYYAKPIDDSNENNSGFVSAYGYLLSKSDDQDFKDSIEQGNWSEEAGGFIPGDTPSIFSGANNPELLNLCSSSAPIEIELMPLAALFTDTNKAWPWERFVKGALLQKYGDSITVPFRRLVNEDWSKLFPETVDKWASTIVTPHINVYQERVNLSEIKMNASDVVEVKSLSIFSQILETKDSSEMVLPGKNITLISQIIDTAMSPNTPVIKLSSQGFENLTIHCHEMYGALSFEEINGTRRRVLLDGFTFMNKEDKDPDSGRHKIDIAEVTTEIPEAKLMESNKNNILFALNSASVLINSSRVNTKRVRIVERDFLLWIASIIPSGTTDLELANARLQALYLAKVSRNLKTEGVIVPYQDYSTYSNHINKIVKIADGLTKDVRDFQGQIERQKLLESETDTEKKLNKNVKLIGQKLVDFFDLLSNARIGINQEHHGVLEQLEKEFNSSVTDIESLNHLLVEQINTVDDIVKEVVDEYKQGENDKIFMSCINLIKALFKPSTNLEQIPNGTDITIHALHQVYQSYSKIKNALHISNQLLDMNHDRIEDIRDAANTIMDIDGIFQLPSQLELNDLSERINTVLSHTGINGSKNKTKLVQAIEVLVLRGQLLLEAKVKKAKFYSDINFNGNLKNLNQNQLHEFKNIRESLNLLDENSHELAAIDLIGITGKLQFQLKQILHDLTAALNLQDAAVQYEHLGKPMWIKKYDLLGVATIMKRQNRNLVNGLKNLNPRLEKVDKPIEYIIKNVPISALKDGNLYGFAVQPSQTEFHKYMLVRVDRVVANVIGIKSTKSKSYQVDLTFEGNPFVDRDFNQKMFTFNTASRNFGPYNYGIDGTEKFNAMVGEYDEKSTKITPFSHWQISLPQNKTNEAIEFDGLTVDIVLHFNITAQHVDPAKKLALHLAGQASPALMTNFVGATQNLMAADVATASAATLNNITEQMYQDQAVLQGWDVVFNLLEEPVNEFLKKQWQEKIKSTDNKMEIKSIWCEGVHNLKLGGKTYYYTNITLLDVNLSQPLLQFNTNNHSTVTVKQNILSGTLKTGTLTVSGPDYDPSKCNIDPKNPDINWDEDGPATIDTAAGPYIQATVPLSKVQGIVDPPTGDKKNTHSIILDFPASSFALSGDDGFKLINNSANWDPAHHATKISNTLADWYNSHDIKYIVNTINFSNLTTLEALQPKSFKLNVQTTNSGNNILQQFITTNGTQQSGLTINLNEPIPYDSKNPVKDQSDFDVSMLINTKIMFQNIFVDSFNSSGKSIKAKSIDPGKDFKAYSAEISSGNVTGTVDFKNDNYRINANNNNIVWDISGLTFKRTNGPSGLALNYSTQKTVKFQYNHDGWGDHSAKANFEISGNYPMKVNGSGKDQVIQIDNIPPNVEISKDSSLKPTGACETNDNDMKITLLKEMAKDVPGAIQAQIAGIKFDPISIFALENLLFPSSEIIEMKAARIPGDLLIVGRFTK